MGPNNNPSRILAIFAHPDDETMFLGGTLAFLATLDLKVHFVCATRGEGGEMGDPPICDRDDLGQVREEELRCAVGTLGGASLQFLDYKDRVVGPEGELYPFTDDIDLAARDLEGIIRNLKPEVILTHGAAGEYGHPSHIQVHQAVKLALSMIPEISPALYSPGYPSRETGLFTPVPDFLLDISPWLDCKILAASCHRSQHDLFIRNGSSRAGRPVTLPEMIRPLEALAEISSPVPHQKRDWFQEAISRISIPHSGSAE